MAMSEDRTRAVPPPPAPPPRRRGPGWLWPLLALILLVLALLLLLRACGDDDGDDANGGGTTAAQVETTDDGTGGGDTGAGSLTAGGEDMLAAAGGSLTQFSGDVEGSGLEVVSVVEDAGFWVGSQDNRVFVEVEDETGLDELGVEQGAIVDFTGVVEQNDEAETYGLREGDAQLFRAQGAHVSVQAADVDVE